jgi:putative transposase
MPAFYRASEAKLATSQQARKNKRVKAIHAKIRNRRKDFLHKETTKLVRQYGFIAVGM